MIKSFKQFINEEVSGTELVGPIGPAYGETRLQNKTVTFIKLLLHKMYSSGD